MAKTKKKTGKGAATKKSKGLPRVSVTTSLPASLAAKFAAQGKALGLPPEHNAALMIDNGVAPQQLTDDKKRHAAVKSLAALITKLPGVKGRPGVSEPDEAFWWIKFGIDTRHELAWHVIQRLGFVINYYSLEEQFQTTFCPVSPPPYLNGGPREYLSWVIEAKLRYVDPRPVLEALRDELPPKLESVKQWREYDDE